MKIGIASDHRGYKLKTKVIKYLKRKKYDVIDYGTNKKESVDFPDYVFKLGENLADFEYGIVICGTGIGVSIAANKVKGVRCAKVNSRKEAIMARKHNDANLIALNEGMFLPEAKDILDAFLKTEFKNEERLIRRNKKISDYEEKR